MQESLVRRIRELLSTEPGISAREISAAIADPKVTKNGVNSVLHAQQDVFEKTDDTPPRWSLRAAGTGPGSTEARRATGSDMESTTQTTERATTRPSDRLVEQRANRTETLSTWQRQALSAWKGHQHCGVVEAVDGSGKTTLGVAAAAEALDAGHPVLIMVADNDAQDRWAEALHAALPSRRIVVSGAGSTPSHGDLTVVTAHAAIQDRLFDKHSGNQPTALIVDDVHAYSAGAYAKALLPRFTWRLGLTSALERSDDLVGTVVLPYFERIINGCDYLHAVQTGLLPRIELVHVPLPLTERERHVLNAVDDRAEQALDKLVGTYGAPDAPAEAKAFARAAVDVKGPAAVFAKRYLDALARRSEILGECQSKITLLQALPVATLERTRSIFFTDHALAANRAVQLLGHDGYRITRVGEPLSTADRRDIARRLRERSLHAVVERQLLDTSLDFPPAGLGMFLASDLTPRELVQRLGRVIRRGSPHAPIVVLAYVEGTVEDPRRVGPHLRQLTQIAEEFVVADIKDLPDLLDRWIPESASSDEPDRIAARPSALGPKPIGEHGSAGEAQTVPKSERSIEPERSTAPEEQEIDTVTAELTAALLAEGGVATADELGDLIGLTDPREMFAAVSAAADSGRLEFHQIEPGSEELILLSAESGGTTEQRRAAVATIADWAVRSADPLDEFHGVVRDLAPMHVPRHRLIGIAAFLRGTTAAGLL